MKQLRQKALLALIGVTVSFSAGAIILMLTSEEGVKQIHVETITVDISTGKKITNDSAYPVLMTESKNGDYYVQGAGENFIVNLTPDQQSSLYIVMKTTGYDVDREQTFRTDQIELNTCAESEIFGDGQRYFVCGINNDNWQFKYENHISFVAYVHKSKPENQTLPIIYMNQTGVDMSNQPTLTEATNRAELYPNDTLVEKTNKDNCCYYKSVDKDILSNSTTEISTELHKQGETRQLWWTDINGTHDCKVYRYDSSENGFESYTFNGVGCTEYQADKFDKAQYAMDHPSNEELTEGTNACTVGFGCPSNATSELTYGTETQMLWAKIQDQNKQILENQNIMMCLEVVKNPDSWVQIGKYLTERGVNCTGLDIRGLQ